MNEFLDTVVGWTRGSVLYRWLLREPEPEIIVIDLRETYTVGLVLELFDRAISGLGPTYYESRLRSSGQRVTTAVLSAPIRAASLVLGILAVVILGRQLISEGFSVTSSLPLLALLVVAAAGSMVTRSWDELSDSRPVQHVITLWEPPESTEEPADEPP